METIQEDKELKESNLLETKDRHKLTKAFLKKIGLIVLFTASLYLDSKHLAGIFSYGQELMNVLSVIAFLVLYKHSVLRTRKLLIYTLLLGTIGEYLFSIVLNMYSYRLSNIPFYILFCHPVMYERVYSFSKDPIIRHYKSQIIKIFYVAILMLTFFYLLVYNDVFGFILTAIFLLISMLKKAKGIVLYLLTRYIIIAIGELGGTIYGVWEWPDTAFGIFTFLPSHNPPSGISLFYLLLDVTCFVIYTQVDKNTWKRFKSRQKLKAHG